MKKALQSTVSVLLLLIPVFAQAQERLDTLKGLYRSFYLPDRDMILRTYSDGITLDHPDAAPNTARIRIKGWQPGIGFNDFFSSGGFLISLDRHDRSVYRIIGDSMQVEDRIPNPQMTINANLFRHDSITYLMGGYGLWSARKGMLQLNPEFHRWEPVRIGKPSDSKSNMKLPPGLHEHLVVQDGQAIYVFYGREVNPNNPIELPLYRQVWMFDMKEHQWTELGELNSGVFHEFPDAPAVIRVENRSFVFPGKSLVAELSASENRVILHQPTLFSREAQQSDQFRFLPFYRKGKIHYYRRLDTQTDLEQAKYQFMSVPLDKFLGETIGEDRFYLPLNRWWIWLTEGMAGVTILWLGYVFFRRRKKLPLLELSENGILCRTVFHEVDPLAIKVLKKLLDTDGQVPSGEILDLIQNPNLKYAHNNRVKNTIIRQLNLQLRSILNIKEDLITSVAAPEDKRYRFYKIDKVWFRSGGAK